VVMPFMLDVLELGYIDVVRIPTRVHCVDIASLEAWMWSRNGHDPHNVSNLLKTHQNNHAITEAEPKTGKTNARRIAGLQVFSVQVILQII